MTNLPINFYEESTMIEYNGDDVYFKNNIILPFNDILLSLKRTDMEDLILFDRARSLCIDLVSYASHSLKEWYNHNHRQIEETFFEIELYREQTSNLLAQTQSPLDTSTSSSSHSSSSSTKLDLKEELPSRRNQFFDFMFRPISTSGTYLNWFRRNELKEIRDINFKRNHLLQVQKESLSRVDQLLKTGMDLFEMPGALSAEEEQILEQFKCCSSKKEDPELTPEEQAFLLLVLGV